MTDVLCTVLLYSFILISGAKESPFYDRPTPRPIIIPQVPVTTDSSIDSHFETPPLPEGMCYDVTMGLIVSEDDCTHSCITVWHYLTGFCLDGMCLCIDTIPPVPAPSSSESQASSEEDYDISPLWDNHLNRIAATDCQFHALDSDLFSHMSRLCG